MVSMLSVFRKLTKADFLAIRLLFMLIIIGNSSELYNVLTAENKKLIFHITRWDGQVETEFLNEYATILLEKKIQINLTNWYYNIVLESNQGESILSLVTILICCISGLVIVWKLDPKDFFKHDVSKPLLVIVFSIMLYLIIKSLMLTYIDKQLMIQHIIPNSYKLVRSDNWYLTLLVLGFGWLARIMKIGHQLQKEQDLTI